MNKYLLNSYGDFVYMLEKEWLNGMWKPYPNEYPCVAIVRYSLEPGQGCIEFVYQSDFKNA